LHFLNPETKQRHRFVLKHPNGRFPDPRKAGLDEALELALIKFIDLKTRTDRGEAVNVLTIGERVARFLTREEQRVSTTPHTGITPARFRLLRNQCKHFLDFCSRKGGCGAGKQVHQFRTSGCLLTALGRGLPPARTQIEAMLGNKTCSIGRDLGQENQSSRPLLETPLCDEQSCALLK
jgi:hypothetical protein